MYSMSPEAYDVSAKNKLDRDILRDYPELVNLMPEMEGDARFQRYKNSRLHRLVEHMKSRGFHRQ